MKNSDVHTFIFAGGGTGGHIYPGLAVADELRAMASSLNIPVKILWIGNSSGMDRDIITKSGSVDVFYGVPSGKLRRYFSLQNFADVFKIFAGFVKSFFFILRNRPVVLFSKGGFVSVPPCIAASMLKVPVFTHECDFTPGLATKINSRFAERILVSYEETKKYLSVDKREKAVVTGNPVRPVFYSTKPENGRKFLFENRPDYNPEKPVLLVLGGSLGAHQINELVVENLDFLTKNFNVVHQCGGRDASSMPQNVNGYFLHPFIYSEMPDVVSQADVILSRAGANSIWECSVLGKPMILVPLCGSGTRGDQVDNARYFEENGAACVLLGKDADSENLKKAVEVFLDAEKRKIFSENASKLSAGNRPANKIAELIFDYIKKGE